MIQSTYLTHIAGVIGTLGMGTLSALSISVSPASANDGYPANFDDAFLQGCRNSASANAERLGLTPDQIEDYCNCSLTEIQSRYTFAELQQQLGSVDLFSITCDCAKASNIGSVIAQCSQ